MKDCLTIMCQLYQNSAAFSSDIIHPENSSGKLAENSDTPVTVALLEVGKNACIAMQKFLTVVSFPIMSLQASLIQFHLRHVFVGFADYGA